MSEPVATRAGLNAAEASLAWAAARFGASDTLWQRVDPAAGLELRQAHKRLPTGAARAEALTQWRAQDREAAQPATAAASASPQRQARWLAQLSPRWQQVLRLGSPMTEPGDVAAMLATRGLISSAPPRALIQVSGVFDPGMLTLLPAQGLGLAITRLGAFQLAEVLRRQDRRQLVRTLRELPPVMQAWARDDLQRERQVDPDEAARIQEAVVAISREHKGWDALALHLGLAFVAASCGWRWEDRAAALRARLPPQMAAAFEGYLSRSRASSRRLEAQVIESLSIILDQLPQVPS